MEHAKAVKEWSWQILHISSNQHNLKPKSFRERRKIKQNSLKWVEGENMIKIRAEIKEKKWLKKKKKPKSVSLKGVSWRGETNKSWSRLINKKRTTNQSNLTW